MILRGMSGESTWASSWGMSDGVLSGACLGQHLGHIVNNGQQSVVLHASVMLFLSTFPSCGPRSKVLVNLSESVSLLTQTRLLLQTSAVGGKGESCQLPGGIHRWQLFPSFSFGTKNSFPFSSFSLVTQTQELKREKS